MSKDDRERLQRSGVFVFRENELLGPYTKEKAEELLEDGSIDSNELVKIGCDGKPFPAAYLAGQTSEE